MLLHGINLMLWYMCACMWAGRVGVGMNASARDEVYSDLSGQRTRYSAL